MCVCVFGWGLYNVYLIKYRLDFVFDFKTNSADICYKNLNVEPICKMLNISFKVSHTFCGHQILIFCLCCDCLKQGVVVSPI